MYIASLAAALAVSFLSLSATAQGTGKVDSVTCGNNRYTRTQLDQAAAEGCRLIAARQQLGTNNYPHAFNNREGLVFTTSGPYQEWPIISNGNYTGGQFGCRSFRLRNC